MNNERYDEDRAKGSELEGISLGRYPLNKLESTTKKTWLYKGDHPAFNIPIAIKVLKPCIDRDRIKLFRKEAEKLIQLNHPNIVRVHDIGTDKGYHFIVLDWEEGGNLEEHLERLQESNQQISLETILEMITPTLEALDYARVQGAPHTDVKPKNIMLKSDGKSTCMVDFGYWDSSDPKRNDVSGTAEVLKELLNHRENLEKEIPSQLTQIIKRAETNVYKTPRELKTAIDKFRKSGSRRKFLRATAGVVASATALAGLAYLEHRKRSYRNSINFVPDEIVKVEASDYKNIRPFLKELEFRLIDQKIRWLAKDKIQEGEFPYAVPGRKYEYAPTNGSAWTSGFWPGILWRSYQTIKDERFRNWAIEWANAMNFTEKDRERISSIRFYYSHALGYDITGNESFLETALKAADLISKRFNPHGKFIQASGALEEKKVRELRLSSMTTALPLLLWGFKYCQNFSDYIKDHCETVARVNINEDGSVIQSVNFDISNRTRIEGVKREGYSKNSCVSREQARAIKGFTNTYQTLRDQEFLETAEKCAKYFIDNLPPDKVPFYDFKDPNENIPKDSSAAAIAASGLLDLFNATSNPEYKLTTYQILKSLSTNYLSRQRGHQGLLLHACIDKNESFGHDCSLIYGDYHVLEALSKI